MSSTFLGGVALGLTICSGLASDFTPAPQQFQQELALRFSQSDGAPPGAVQLIECPPGGPHRAFAAGQWYDFRDGHWRLDAALNQQTDNLFLFADRQGHALADAAARWRHLYREGIPYFALFANAYNHPNAFGHGLFVEEILRCLED